MKKNTKKALSCAAIAAVMTFSSGLCALSASADWHTTTSGSYYYTNESGKKVTGWVTIGGQKYLFSKNGYAATGFQTIGGKTFYFIKTKKGQMATGWQKIGSSTYYFGTNGVMRTGWRNIDGNKYYFSSDGKMATGKTKIDGKVYTFNEKGVYVGSGGTSSSSSSDLSSIKLGAKASTVDKYIKNSKYKNQYVSFSLPSGASVAGVVNADFSGISDCTVSLLYNKSGTLICIEVMNYSPDAYDLLESAVKNDYPISTEMERDGQQSVVYMKDVSESTPIAMLTKSSDGSVILRLTEHQYLEDVGKIYEEFYSQIG